MKRIMWLAVMVWLLAVGHYPLSISQNTPTVAQTCPTARAATSSPTYLADHITLTWTEDPATTMTVTWRTNKSAIRGFVQYSKGSEITKQAIKVKATASTFATDLSTSKLFSATLTGLLPATKYTYRVGDGIGWSAPRSFTTADPKASEFEFLVFGDTQSPAGGNNPYSEWRETIHKAYKANPNARFFMNVGDLVDVGQSEAHWNGWFAAAAGVIDMIPAMPVTGNHETSGGDDRWPTYYNAQFRLPQNGPTGLKTQVYSFDYGPVHFVVLDSQQSEQKAHGDILTPQKEWLDKDLSTSKATWKIGLFHKAVYPLKRGRSYEDVKKAFGEMFDKHHVDLVFNGHDHAIARTYPMNNGIIKRNPSKGTVYFVTGRSGSKTYDDVSKRDYNTFFYSPQDQPNYLVVKVSNSRLTVNTFKTDGTLIDTFYIDKERDIDSDFETGKTVSAQ